ncbi:MAG: hypothetical protein Q4C78_03810 [Synergistaceae bacterium]|nr:hypothetical protein [Synergistaceae bacterium]
MLKVSSFLLLIFTFLINFGVPCSADVKPCMTNLCFAKEDIASHNKQKILFTCDGADKKVTSISVSCKNLNGSVVSWSVRMVNGESYVEITPVKAGGDVTLELTAKGDGGGVYRDTMTVMFK